MNEEQIKLIARTVAQEIADSTSGPCHCSIETETHKKHHEALGRMIETLDRISAVKYGVLRGVLQALSIAAIFGLVAFLWKHGIPSK